MNILKTCSKKYITFRQIFYILILVLTVNYSSTAQSNLDTKITKGLTHLYNFEFIKSNKVFNEIIEVDSSNPAGYHFQSIAYLWFYLDSKNDKDREKFLLYTDSCISKSQALITTDTADIFIHYILGSTYSSRALVFARASEYLNALWATKESYSHLNKAISIDSLFADAYFGLGLFNFAVAQTPSAWKWALDLTGITGDRTKGMKYLTFAAEKGKFSAIDAQFYLSQLNAEFMRDFTTAHYYLDKLTKKFPSNLLFKSTAASLLIKEKKLKNSEKILFSITESKDSTFKQIKNYANLFLGDIFFTRNNFDSAKTFFKKFLVHATDSHFKGMAALKLGLCFYITGSPNLAMEFFELAGEGNTDLDEDNFADDICEIYLESPPDSIQVRLIFIKNLIDAGSYSTAIDSLKSLSKYSVSEEIKAFIDFYTCDAKFYLGGFKESKQIAISLIENEYAEKWVRAFACYFAARASVKLGSIVDTKLFLSYANDFNDFHFENKLRNLIYSLSYKFQQ